MRKISFVKILLIISLFVSILLIALKGSTFDAASSEPGQELKLYLGESKDIPVSNPTRIAIGNPTIADITTVTKDVITLSPKQTGKTTFVFWDDYGEQSYQIKVFTEDINEIKRRIDNLLEKLNLPEVYTQAEEEEGKVLLLGRVKNEEEKASIGLVLGALQAKTVDLIKIKEEEAMVEIEVQVLELNKDATKMLGFTWPSSSTTTPLQTITESTPAATIATKFSTLFVVEKFTRTAFAWKIDALAQEGKVRILSRPRLSCQSGKEAELSVGGEKPIFTTQTVTGGGTGTEVEYKEYGIKLKIKPTVTEEKRIKLALNIEVSEVGSAEYIGLTSERTAQAYPLTKRTASTELYLDNGQTMAIGGLIKQKLEEDVTKTPGLGDLPILGLFFRKKTTKIGGGSGERGEAELFITLTPTIITEKEVPKEGVSEEKKPTIEVKSLETKVLPLELQNYIKAVQTKIINAVYYPKEARDASWQGILKLSLLINADGNLENLSVVQSSGYKILDDAGQEAVKKVAPFPTLPAQLNLKELRIEIPIVYHKE